MFDLAGIFLRDLLRHTDLDQVLRQRLVPVIDLPRDGIALVRQGDQVIRAHLDIPVLLQLFHGHADGRLGNVQAHGDINGDSLRLIRRYS